jgi:erythromycin esterase
MTKIFTTSKRGVAQRTLLAAIGCLLVTTVAQAGDVKKPTSREQREQKVNAIIRTSIAQDLRESAVALPELGTNPNFDVVAAAVDSKKLIGLGESTHGTAECFQIKGSIILALAKKHKVRVLLEEQPICIAPLNEWVAGKAPYADLNNRVNAMFFDINKVNEFATFLKGVREWNAKADSAHQIELYGVDIYGMGSANPVPVIKTFLKANGIAMDQEMGAINAFSEKYGNVPPMDLANAEAAAAKLDAVVSVLPPTTPGKTEINIITHGLLRFTQVRSAFMDNFSTVVVNTLGDTPANIPGNGIRDAGMAENIKLLMDGKAVGDDKTVYWAHNGHIARISALDGDPIGLPSTWGTAGSILNAWLGDDYAPIAIATGAGSARLMMVDDKGQYGDFMSIQLPFPPSDSLNTIASELFPKQPVFFLTKGIPFMGFTRPEILIGATYELKKPERAVANNVPGLAYFGIVSAPLTHASTSLILDKTKDSK